jgi:hypothetical protein
MAQKQPSSVSGFNKEIVSTQVLTEMEPVLLDADAAALKAETALADEF